LFFSDVSAESSYHSVDPYSGYPTAAYGYPPATSGAPPSSVHYAAYDYTSPYKTGPTANETYHLPPSASMVPHRPEYYPPRQAPHPMHYIHHQPPAMPYR
jgi:hypothetical protein